MRRVRFLPFLLLCGFAAFAPAQRLPEASSTQAGIRSFRPAVPGVRGLVTTAGKPLATMSGIRMLVAGGNAVDAAVAVLATLNVVEPEMSGAGGNGFMLIYHRKSGRIENLSMTGAAPKGLQADKMTPESLATGVDAAPVPGLFGGWIAALERHGTRTLSECLESAIDYAENGHPIDPTVVGSIESRRSDLLRFETSARIFLPGGKPPAAGDLFRLKDLGATFRKLTEAEQEARKRGSSRAEALQAAFDRFYKGDVARDMIAFIRERGGTMASEDLASYQPIWSEPIHTTYRGYDVYSTPPSSRGGLEVLMQLNLIEGYDLPSIGRATAAAIHLQAEAVKVAKADVYQYVSDPKASAVPVEGMISKEYASRRRLLIDPKKSIPYPAPGRPPGSPRAAAPRTERGRLPEPSVEGHTTSFSIVDAEGNVVVCTPTLGSAFGTAAVLGSTGILFNNGLRHGSTAPYPDHVNFARPGQVPILNNSPILVFRDGRFVLALGTPGGETIGQTQFQVILNVLDFGLSIQEAIEAPRFALEADPSFYRSGTRIVMRMEDGMGAGVVRALEKMGHSIERRPRFGGIGNMQGIWVDLRTGAMTAGADPRRSGYAMGW